MTDDKRTPLPLPQQGRDWAAFTLAVGIAAAINFITLGVLVDAIVNDDAGLSENATQVLTTAFGGMIGVLGSYLGFRAGRNTNDEGTTDDHRSGTQP